MYNGLLEAAPAIVQILADTQLLSSKLLQSSQLQNHCFVHPSRFLWGVRHWRSSGMKSRCYIFRKLISSLLAGILTWTLSNVNMKGIGIPRTCRYFRNATYDQWWVTRNGPTPALYSRACLSRIKSLDRLYSVAIMEGLIAFKSARYRPPLSRGVTFVGWNNAVVHHIHCQSNR